MMPVEPIQDSNKSTNKISWLEFSGFYVRLTCWKIRRKNVASPAGLEPATPGLGNRCSIRLSYGDPVLCRTML